MAKQVQEAYIVAATRTPIGRSHRGFFRNTRPDDLLVKVLHAVLAQAPTLETVFDGLADFLSQHMSADVLQALIEKPQ